MGLVVESESYFCFLISGCFFFDYNMRGICRRQDWRNSEEVITIKTQYCEVTRSPSNIPVSTYTSMLPHACCVFKSTHYRFSSSCLLFQSWSFNSDNLGGGWIFKVILKVAVGTLRSMSHGKECKLDFHKISLFACWNENYSDTCTPLFCSPCRKTQGWKSKVFSRSCVVRTVNWRSSRRTTQTKSLCLENMLKVSRVLLVINRIKRLDRAQCYSSYAPRW